MNDKAALLGYIAYNSLKKLVPAVRLQDIHASYPYVTLSVEMPFVLQSQLTTAFLEDLRSEVKKGDYRVFEMMPSLAREYAKHKKMAFELVDESHIIVVFETPHVLVQVLASECAESLELPCRFDLVLIKSYGAVSQLTLALGEDIKELKKNLQKSSDFSVTSYLESAKFIDSAGVWLDRGLQLLDYYKQIFLKPFRLLGASSVLLEESDEHGKVLCQTSGQVFDPLTLGPLAMGGVSLACKFPISCKKINSLLKSLIKILKMLEFRIQINFHGKFPDSDKKILSSEIEDVIFSRGDGRSIVIKIMDPFKRSIDVAHVAFSKKESAVHVKLVDILLLYIAQNHKAFPEAFVRPKQVAVCGLLSQRPELLDVLTEALLEGSHAFSVEQKDLMSDKQALEYQIDCLLYWSEAEAKIKTKLTH